MFKQLSYTSSIIWHFVRGSGTSFEEKSDDSLKTVLDKIFVDDLKGRLLVSPPGIKDKFYRRNLELEISSDFFTPGSEVPLDKSQIELLEPRAICFADIPVNNLPIHINRYFGIGFGFRRNVLINKIDDLKPVHYYPRKNEFSLKTACVNYVSGENTFELHNYSKIPSTSETFDEIYNEREWRSLSDIEFSHEDLALIFFPTRSSLSKALQEPKILNMVKNGVGIFCGEDMFDPEEGRK